MTDQTFNVYETGEWPPQLKALAALQRTDITRMEAHTNEGHLLKTKQLAVTGLGCSPVIKGRELAYEALHCRQH